MNQRLRLRLLVSLKHHSTPPSSPIAPPAVAFLRRVITPYLAPRGSASRLTMRASPPPGCAALPAAAERDRPTYRTKRADFWNASRRPLSVAMPPEQTGPKLSCGGARPPSGGLPSASITSSTGRTACESGHADGEGDHEIVCRGDRALPPPVRVRRSLHENTTIRVGSLSQVLLPTRAPTHCPPQPYLHSTTGA